MGSSGTGRLSDYSGRSSGGSSKTGGKSNEDKCERAFSTLLEDVERCTYYKTNSALPANGTVIEVVFKKPRLAAVTNEGIIVGYLPTDRNYIKACIENGYSFPGAISSSRLKPLPSVQITVSPHK